jgi:GNAT superfamily N-acetyltransferase
MTLKFSIREIRKEEMLLQLPLINQLSPDIKQKDYERMLDEMLSHGYRMVGIFDGEKCIGISGFWIGTKFYSDKYLEPDNVVIDKNYRSKGIGKLLLDWLTEEAKRNNCKTIMLDAYLENIQGHKFYWREGFVARGFHFLKKL